MRLNVKDLYDQNKNIIHKTCFDISIRTNSDYPELLTESNSIFWNTLRSYNCKHSQLTTWLVNNLRYALWNHAKRIPFTDSLEDCEMDIPEENESFLVDLMEDLSEESKEIIHLIFNPPQELSDMVIKKDDDNQKKGMNRKILKSYLLKKEWNYSTIRKCFVEIKNYLRES